MLQESSLPGGRTLLAISARMRNLDIGSWILVNAGPEAVAQPQWQLFDLQTDPGEQTDLAAANPQPLNWRTSIVDLMKLLDLDSSLSARKELAHELGYSGDTADSASMNIWLHKQVMQKLAQNGGKVPAELKD